MKQWFNKVVDSVARGIKKIPDFIKSHSPTILSWLAYGAVYSAVCAITAPIAAGLALSLLPALAVTYIPALVVGIAILRGADKAVTRKCEEKGIIVAQKKRDWGIGVPSFIIGSLVTSLTICPFLKENVQKMFNEKADPIKTKSATEQTYNIQNGSGVFKAAKVQA